MKITSIEINQTGLINWCKKCLNHMINANGIMTTPKYDDQYTNLRQIWLQLQLNQLEMSK